MSEEFYTIRQARRSDLPAVLSVQHKAFSRVAAQAGIDAENLEPLRETLEELDALLERGTTFIVAVDRGGAVIGSVRGRAADGVVMVNRLVVDDGWERRGIGAALMDALEHSFEDATLFRLFTGAEAVGPLALYHARGYRTVEVQDMGQFELAWLEKPGPKAVS